MARRFAAFKIDDVRSHIFFVFCVARPDDRDREKMMDLKMECCQLERDVQMDASAWYVVPSRKVVGSL